VPLLFSPELYYFSVLQPFVYRLDQQFLDRAALHFGESTASLRQNRSISLAFGAAHMHIAIIPPTSWFARQPFCFDSIGI
jgi:hypothetical protein